ncbi:MAG TPA: terminase small subunit [Noviherbaspirillum sp.]|nr:terminase small subunit [Noviherbaspirillum sp.]
MAASHKEKGKVKPATAAKAKAGKLTPKQEMFVAEYLVDLNATQAAIRSGYSAKNAHKIASELLGKSGVAEAIAKAKAKRTERTEITQDRVLQELYRLCFVDIRKAFNDDGTLKPIHELDDDTAAALSGIEVQELNAAPGSPPLGFTKKFKLIEKKGPLELLMRHMGMLNDKLKLQGDAENPLNVLLQQIGGSALPVKKDGDEE